MSVKYQDLIELVPFVQYVQNKSKDYLNHHPYPLNDKPPPGFKIPVSEGKAAATFPDIKWSITELNCKNNVDKLCNSFINSNSGKIIDASDTLDFILKCFYEVCRIYEYKFSYYETVESTSLTEKIYFGLKDSYYSVDKKKHEYKGGRTFQEYKTDFIEKYKDCGIYGPIGEKKGNIIYASSVTEIVDKLIEFNKSNEMCEDWGQRNDKEQWYEYSIVARSWSYSTTDQAQGRAEANGYRNNGYKETSAPWGAWGAVLKINTQNDEKGYFAAPQTGGDIHIWDPGYKNPYKLLVALYTPIKIKNIY